MNYVEDDKTCYKFCSSYVFHLKEQNQNLSLSLKMEINPSMRWVIKNPFKLDLRLATAVTTRYEDAC